MVKKLLSILITLAFFGCGGSSLKDPVSNNTPTESGGTVWSSSYFNGRVQIDKEFKFLGSQDRSDQKAERKYYVWKKDLDTFVYVIDLKVKGTWTFPQGADGLLKAGFDDPDLLVYEPFKYSIWKKMHSNADKTLKELGLVLPMCYAAFEKAKLSPSRSAAFFVLYVEKTGCDYESYGGIGTRFNSAVSM